MGIVSVLLLLKRNSLTLLPSCHQFVPSATVCAAGTSRATAVWPAGESRAVWRHDDERGHAA